MKSAVVIDDDLGSLLIGNERVLKESLITSERIKQRIKELTEENKRIDRKISLLL